MKQTEQIILTQRNNDTTPHPVVSVSETLFTVDLQGVGDFFKCDHLCIDPYTESLTGFGQMMANRVCRALQMYLTTSQGESRREAALAVFGVVPPPDQPAVVAGATITVVPLPLTDAIAD